MDCYFGTYQTFETVSKKEGAVLAGPDNLVGDAYEITFEFEEGKRIAWLKNKFGSKVGFFDADFSRKLSIIEARGWVIRPLLSFVAYTDNPQPSRYWGEMAVICYDPVYNAEFEAFAKGISARLADGLRPAIDMELQGIQKVLESKGEWTPAQYAPLPDKVVGTAIIKKSRSAKENLIEQGRKGNKGCYFASWVFLILLAIAVVMGVKALIL